MLIDSDIWTNLSGKASMSILTKYQDSVDGGCPI